MDIARIAIFASGKGSNAQQIIEYFKNHPSVKIEWVLSNNSNAGVLDVAAAHGIRSCVFTKRELSETGTVSDLLSGSGITHIVLAGFLWLVPPSLIRKYPDKIINIHPALLPEFGGKGMYGKHVHEAVKNAKKTVTGITIHLVNEVYDEGAYLFQAKCPLRGTETVEEIASLVQHLEHVYYPRIIEQWIATNAKKLIDLTL